jgi:hypothetical protein
MEMVVVIIEANEQSKDCGNKSKHFEENEFGIGYEQNVC